MVSTAVALSTYLTVLGIAGQLSDTIISRKIGKKAVNNTELAMSIAIPAAIIVGTAVVVYGLERNRL